MNPESDPLSYLSKLSISDTEMTSTFASESADFSTSNSSKPSKIQSLTIRVSDEARIVTSVRDASKKLTSGGIFSVKVDISSSGALGIGVKDLVDNILTVSMLKRSGGVPGAGEAAGIRLGDIVFGINFMPMRDGSRTLLQMLKRENSKKRKYLHLQCWRCHQLCSDSLPGTRFTQADEMFIHSYSLFRTRVFSEWERWNFIEILLMYMMDDVKTRSLSTIDQESLPTPPSTSSAPKESVFDLERNILQAKGLRTALCVRIVHTKTQGETVVYVLRVEDIETGLQWVVHRRYRDFHALHDELADMTSLVKDISFPKKRLAMRSAAKLIESRIVALEQYIRRVIHMLTTYASMDPHASRSLRHVQNFLGVDKYVDCIHPPAVDDQRCIELMAYRFLNDFNSPACQQCVRFVESTDVEDIVAAANMDAKDPEGYRPVLTYMHRALAEVENFVIQQHNQQMTQELRERRPDLGAEDARVFIRKCVRRQVEAALYLPLRRSIFRIVYSYLATKAQKIQRAMTTLQQADPAFFTLDAYVLQASSLPKAIKAFRDVIQAYLPADQGQLLMHAAAAVANLHVECREYRKSHPLTASTSSQPASLHVPEVLSSVVEPPVATLPVKDKEKEKKRMSLDIGKLFGKKRGSSEQVEPGVEPLRATELTTQAVLDDPVREMFSADETIPSDTVLRSEPRRSSGETRSTELTPAAGEDDDDAPAEVDGQTDFLDNLGAAQDVANSTSGFYDVCLDKLDI